jgi:hypothetical protein
MRTTLFVTAGALVFAACGGNPENSAACGFSFVAGASMIIQQANSPNAFLTAPPRGLSGTVPARVVGHGSAKAIVGTTPQGVMLGYEGDGFPTQPGYGLVLVDDSSDLARGVLIYEPTPPMGFPTIGQINGGQATLPLYATRVHWGAISDPKCPMFQPVDSIKH